MEDVKKIQLKMNEWKLNIAVHYVLYTGLEMLHVSEQSVNIVICGYDCFHFKRSSTFIHALPSNTTTNSISLL